MEVEKEEEGRREEVRTQRWVFRYLVLCGVSLEAQDQKPYTLLFKVAYSKPSHRQALSQLNSCCFLAKQDLRLWLHRVRTDCMFNSGVYIKNEKSKVEICVCVGIRIERRKTFNI
jgi:hypothetical protein